MDEYEHWVCYGAGGWADADIHLGDMLGSFLDRFGMILESFFISLVLFYGSFGSILESFWVLEKTPRGSRNAAKYYKMILKLSKYGKMLKKNTPPHPLTPTN